VNILITGGAGYIGSHVVKQLLETTDYNITILDDLSTGSKKTLETLRAIRNFKFIELDLKEFDKIADVLNTNNFDNIFHFAASTVVPESVTNPIKYYMNNTVNTTNLIKCAVDSKVKKFIFSSTAAVYGEPMELLKNGISEEYQTNPINPYGMSKLMSERIIQDTALAHKDFKFVIFRYFNVAGADINYVGNTLTPRIGQSFLNATHLIKVASECATEKRETMAIFGNDFNTSDGTGVRDYIHVDDLASAHILAIEYLKKHHSDIFNIGYSKGFSVREVVKTMKKVTGTNFKVETQERRVGDLANLISDNTKIKTKMNWIAQYDDLDLICKSAFEWEKIDF